MPAIVPFFTLIMAYKGCIVECSNYGFNKFIHHLLKVMCIEYLIASIETQL